MTSILGISAFYHDSAACLVVDGDIIAAAQEERFSRKKHDSGYPINAVNFVLEYGNFKLNDIDHIVFYEKPFLKFKGCWKRIWLLHHPDLNHLVCQCPCG